MVRCFSVGRGRERCLGAVTFPAVGTGVACPRAAVPIRTRRWGAEAVRYLVRYEGRKGVVVTLKIRLRAFGTHTRFRTLRVSTENGMEIFQAARGVFQAEPWTRSPLGLTELGLFSWERAAVQPDMFAADEAPDSHPPEDRLNETLDAIRTGSVREPSNGACIDATSSARFWPAGRP